MSIAGHLDALKRKHGALEDQIAETMARPSPDQSSLTRLKREKLKLKEQIEKLQHAPDNPTHH